MCDAGMDVRLRKRARKAERYKWLKAHGICVKCGSEKAFNGRVCCVDCLYKMQMRAIQYAESSPDAEERRKRHNARQAEWMREQRAQRKAAGMCIRCGKREALDGRVRCERCTYLERARGREAYRRKHQDDPPKPKTERRTTQCKPPVPKANHPWRLDNRRVFRRIKKETGHED